MRSSYLLYSICGVIPKTIFKKYIYIVYGNTQNTTNPFTIIEHSIAVFISVTVVDDVLYFSSNILLF